MVQHPKERRQLFTCLLLMGAETQAAGPISGSSGQHCQQSLGLGGIVHVIPRAQTRA